MNIIEDKRKTIINTNNTAQRRFENILDMMNKGAQELIVNEPLDGDLNLEALETTAVRTLQFTEGQITSIKNVPTRLRVLEVPQNLLVELPSLPITLERLNVSNNYLSEVAFDDVPGLEVLHIADNTLESLPELPSRLRELNVASNRLTRIDLGGAKNLETLDITNNQISSVENLPSSVSNFQSENNPSITYTETQGGEKPKETEPDVPDFTAALNTYFKLKRAYEDDLAKKAKSAYAAAIDRNQTKKEARSRAQNVQGTCGYCKRTVGMVFEQGETSYVARCGSEMDPCNLDIQISTGTWYKLHDEIYTMKVAADDARSNIIQCKLDNLFGYASNAETMACYTQKKDEYDFLSGVLKKMEDAYEDRFHNRGVQSDLKRLTDETFVHIEEIGNHLKEYRETGKYNHMKDAMQLYIDHLLPSRNRMHRLNNNTMEIVQKDGSYKLLTSNGVVSDLAFVSDKGEMVVEKFVVP